MHDLTDRELLEQYVSPTLSDRQQAAKELVARASYRYATSEEAAVQALIRVALEDHRPADVREAEPKKKGRSAVAA